MGKPPIDYLLGSKRKSKKISKRHPGFDKAVEKVLREVVSGKHPKGDAYPGYCCEEYKVCKVRMRVGNLGKSKGGRIIYSIVDERIMVLAVYMKSDVEHEQEAFPFNRTEVHQAIQAHRKSKKPD